MPAAKALKPTIELCQPTALAHDVLHPVARFTYFQTTRRLQSMTRR